MVKTIHQNSQLPGLFATWGATEQMKCIWLTLDNPNPPFTPNPLNSHHIPAPPIPANPVPLDHAPKAVLDVASVGRVVVSCKKVSSPIPEDNEAKDIPRRRGDRDEDSTIILI